CGKSPDCDDPVPDCPPGYSPAAAQGCEYACIPSDRCLCHSDSDCTNPAICDRTQDRCRVPRAPQPRCNHPFDSGSCLGAPLSQLVYAFIDGHCTSAKFGGCDGNDNNFRTMEECLSACEGAPVEHACPEGRIAASICLGCAVDGGCAELGQFCATPCQSNDDCTESALYCVDRLCQAQKCN
ncbi:MAG TPA: BPTI/Kunitz-type proteinase inhibitor domain-containing protein, partial [Polyangiaceae bacterium]|nr:BPTI/Kunitz-type proteinase inhibitor domain-containing protein [Polyangiaceae bacterium]